MNQISTNENENVYEVTKQLDQFNFGTFGNSSTAKSRLFVSFYHGKVTCDKVLYVLTATCHFRSWSKCCRLYNGASKCGAIHKRTRAGCCSISRLIYTSGGVCAVNSTNNAGQALGVLSSLPINKTLFTCVMQHSMKLHKYADQLAHTDVSKDYSDGLI